VNITLENIDLTNTEHLAHAREIYATLSSALLATVQDIRIDFRTLDLIPMHAAEEVPAGMGHDAPKAKLGIYGKTTRAFLQSMLDGIAKNGSVTLEEVATEMGIGLDTARAYLRNGGRTAIAYKTTLPVKAVWNAEMGCNDYHANVV
jgi:hypothetical protein